MTRALAAGLVIALTAAVSAQTPALTIFKARAEAVARIDASRKNLTDPQARAEMALHWAEAMDRAARAIPFGRRQQKTEPYASWIRTNQSYIVYNEPAGQWMLRRDTIINLHRMYPAMDAADDIAWLLVTVGTVGECEGYLPCYVDRQDLTYGAYLRLHPDGRHSEDAMAFLRQWTESVIREGLPNKSMFDPAKDCGELKRSVATLREAVALSRASQHEDVERGLSEVLGWCQ
jgi:hypothetical protein